MCPQFISQPSLPLQAFIPSGLQSLRRSLFPSLVCEFCLQRSCFRLVCSPQPGILVASLTCSRTFFVYQGAAHLSSLRVALVNSHSGSMVSGGQECLRIPVAHRFLQWGRSRAGGGVCMTEFKGSQRWPGTPITILKQSTAWGRVHREGAPVASPFKQIKPLLVVCPLATPPPSFPSPPGSSRSGQAWSHSGIWPPRTFPGLRCRPHEGLDLICSGCGPGMRNFQSSQVILPCSQV